VNFKVDSDKVLIGFMIILLIVGTVKGYEFNNNILLAWIIVNNMDITSLKQK